MWVFSDEEYLVREGFVNALAGMLLLRKAMQEAQEQVAYLLGQKIKTVENSVSCPSRRSVGG
jgi:hypothetical protein